MKKNNSLDSYTFVEKEVQQAIEFTSKIIRETGARITGDNSTHKAAKLIANEFRQYCDTVEEEPFPVHPKAFLGWIKLITALYLFATISVWFSIPLISGLLITIGIVAMVMEFFLYKEFIDPFWRRKIGINVVGKIEPVGEVKQQILISGHHDSAFVFNFFVHQPKLYPVRLYGGLGSVALLWSLSWIWWIIQLTTNKNPTWVLGIKIFAGISLLLVIQMWFFRGKKGTPGAGDNMISVAIANEIGKKVAYLKKSKENSSESALNHTRILICSWDAEEVGLRGSRAFAKKHKKELNSIATYNFNIDCPYYLEDFFFMTSDVNGTVNLSQDMVRECVEIAHSLGYPCTSKPIEFLTGGTDAGEMARIGVKATNLMGMPWGNSNRASVYHTPEDTVDKIEPQAIQAAMNIAWQFIIKKEEELKNNE
ncbi:M28 family metallopeptidase [Candidatus Harpocratesius sp.]